MYDDFSDEIGVFDFDEFADHLLDQGLQASPSQLHGCLTGMLSAEEATDGSLSAEVAEVLRDIAAMAQAEAGPEETEDEAEDSFSELVEYLRVAVVNIFMDNSASVRTEALAPETPRRLH